MKKIKLLDLLKRFKLESITLSTNAASMEITYTNWDVEAAWILYVELITRITTQPLDNESGVEITALDSIHSLFSIVREILKEFGRKATSFTKISLLIMNKIIRPFTSKWHLLSVKNAFEDKDRCIEFRNELSNLQKDLKNYIKLLADMAKVDYYDDFQ